MFSWPGEENAVLVTDLFGHGAKDVIISRFASERSGIVYVWAPPYTKPAIAHRFDYPETGSVRGSQLMAVDMDGDGHRDIVLRQFTGVQTLESIDCVFILDGNKPAIRYERAFFQYLPIDAELDEALPPGEYIRAASSPVEVGRSYFSDLDGDGAIEIIATSDYCPLPPEDCDRASYVVWPDIYKWNGKSYEQADGQFIAYYRQLKSRFERMLKEPYPPRALPFALERTKAILRDGEKARKDKGGRR